MGGGDTSGVSPQFYAIVTEPSYLTIFYRAWNVIPWAHSTIHYQYSGQYKSVV